MSGAPSYEAQAEQSEQVRQSGGRQLVGQTRLRAGDSSRMQQTLSVFIQTARRYQIRLLVPFRRHRPPPKTQSSHRCRGYGGDETGRMRGQKLGSDKSMFTSFRPQSTRDRKRFSVRIVLRALLTLSLGILGVIVAVPTAGAASKTIALVQQSSDAKAISSTLTLTLPASVRAGDALIASFDNTHDSLTITSVSGGGVTWVLGNQENDNQVTADSEIWYGLNATGGSSTVTVHLSGSTDQTAPYYALNISEWSGVGGLDQAPPGIVQHSDSTPASAPAITPSTSGDLFIGVAGAFGDPYFYGPQPDGGIPAGPTGGGFTAFPIETGLPAQGIQHSAYGYLVATNTAPQTYSQPLSAPAEWSATAAAFSPQSIPVPSVTGISPSSGPTTGGTSVTITGSNFSGATSVHFGTSAANSFTVLSPSEITAVSPAQSAGTQYISVTTPGGSSTSQGAASAFTFTSPPPPPPPPPPTPITTPITTPTATPSCDRTLATGTVVGMAATPQDDGYWIANNQGLVVACGKAPNLGELTSAPSHPVVGIMATADGGGYYLFASDGGVFTFGDAIFHGSTGALRLNKPIVGMAVDPATGGYWLVAADGGIFSFNAPFYGSTGNISLNKPVVGMATANGGSGYWMVASDGGVFSFNAPFLGSMGSTRLNKPIVGMTADTASGGYWMVASDGGIFSFKSPFLGSTGGIILNKPIVGMESASTGTGYRFVASDGGTFNFGSSQFNGSAAGV